MKQAHEELDVVSQIGRGRGDRLNQARVVLCRHAIFCTEQHPWDICAHEWIELDLEKIWSIEA